MVKKLVILVTVFSISTAVLGATNRGTATLREGLLLQGIDGTLFRADSRPDTEARADNWLFELGSEVSDGRGRLEAGAELELLPSATLERMVAEMEGSSESDYRLWGRVTKYGGENFIFATRFLPLSKIIEVNSAETEQLQPAEGEPNESAAVEAAGEEPAISEANDVLAVPEEIIERLKTSRTVRMKRQRKTPEALNSADKDSNSTRNSETKPERTQRPESALDPILIDRIGFMHERGQKGPGKWGKAGFTPDGLGQKLEGGSFILLPCEARERAEQEQATEPDQLRFKIAGIVTSYRGGQYLLLQKAIQVYSHGNFPR